MNDTKKIRVKKYKRQVALSIPFKGKCFVCHKKYGKRFAFHHVTYKKEEKTYRDFNSNDNYQLYILPLIQKNPSDFKLLCHNHHYLVERLKLFRPERLERLFDVVSESKS